jgi:hypothetical protein
MAAITLYQYKGLKGQNITFDRTDANLKNDDFPGWFTGNWGDKVSSFRIESGTWRLYEQTGHHGDHTPNLTKGNYNVDQFKALGLEDNGIKSLLLL